MADFREPNGPTEGFAQALSLRRLAASVERRAVDEALAEGWTWARIGEALEMTPQAAHKRLSPGKRRLNAQKGER